jgi:hypothetical protein
MGCYVNPRDGSSKKAWLLAHGRRVGYLSAGGEYEIPGWVIFEVGHLPVVLVDSGPFTAAGVCYCEEEYREFTDPDADREREIYSVPVESLRGVSDVDDYLRHD